ncbi:hypothetical protein D030_3012B, partial [Vibrio parahaemolyticus AQ3810]
PRL